MGDLDGAGLEETLAISEEQLLERHRRGDGVSAEDVTSLLVANHKRLAKNAVIKLVKAPHSSETSSLALAGHSSVAPAASGLVDTSESTVLVEAPTDESTASVEAAARALLGSFPDAALEDSGASLNASLAESTNDDPNKAEKEEALALAAAHAAFAKWDAPGSQQQRQPLAALVAAGAVPRAASLGAWCRLAGAEKAETGGASLAELVLQADGPVGVPAGSRGLDGGPSEGTPGASVDSATRHRIRKDLQRSRCSVEFETTVDSDPMRGSLYRLLIAYACLDPQVGYVQGMNFIAALCLAVAKPDQLSSSVNDVEGTSASSSSSSSSSSGGTGNGTGNAGTPPGASSGRDAAARRAAINAEGTEAAFLLFTRMMQASGLRKVFDTQDDLLHTLILRLDWHLRGCLPALHAHLEQEEVGATMFAVEWITTLFVYNVPFDTARALLGLFLAEGSMVGFVVPLGLALLAHLEAELLARQFDTLVVHLKARLKSFTVGELLGAVRHLGRRMRFVRDYTTTPDTSLQQGSTAGGMAEGAMAENSSKNGAGGSGFSGVGFHGGIVGGLGGGHSSSSGSYGSYGNSGSSSSSGSGEGSSVSSSSHGASGGEYSVAAQLAHVVGSAADSREAWQRLKRPRWVPDDEAFRCANLRCMRYFNALSVRKHHCRACGRVYCGPCAAARCPLPLLAYKGELVRVCAPCTVAGAGAPAAWLFQEFQFQQERQNRAGNASPSSALAPQPPTGTTTTTTTTTTAVAGATLALPAKAWRQCLAFVCDAPVLSIPMLVELAMPIAAHDDDNSDGYSIRSSHGGGPDGPHESIGRAFLGRLGLPAMTLPTSPRSHTATAAAGGENGEPPHEDDNGGVVVMGGEGRDRHHYIHPTNPSTSAGKALAHLFAPLGQGLGALQLPWSTADERGGSENGDDDDDDGWADGDLNGSLDLNSASPLRVVPAAVATRGRTLVASSSGSSSSGTQGSGAPAAAPSSSSSSSSSSSRAAASNTVDEEHTMLTGGVADALLASSPSLSPAVVVGGGMSTVPHMGLDEASSSDPLDLEDVLASAAEDFTRSAQASSSSKRRGSGLDDGLGDNNTMLFGGGTAAASSSSLPDDFLEAFPLPSKGSAGTSSSDADGAERAARVVPGTARAPTSTTTTTPTTAAAKQTVPPPVPPPPNSLKTPVGSTAAATPPPLPPPPRRFSTSLPATANNVPTSPLSVPPPPPVPPPPKRVTTDAVATSQQRQQQQQLVPPPLPPPPKIVAANQADGTVMSPTLPAVNSSVGAVTTSAVEASSVTASALPSSLVSPESSDITSSSGSIVNSSGSSGDENSSTDSSSSAQDSSSQGLSDVLSLPAHEGVASQVTAALVDIFGKAPAPPLPPPSPNSRGVSSDETSSSKESRPGEDLDKAREAALAAEFKALGREFDVDDEYESLRAFVNAPDQGDSSSPSSSSATTAGAPAAVGGNLRRGPTGSSALRTPSAAAVLRADDGDVGDSEDLDDALFGPRPLPPPSADSVLRGSFVDVNTGEDDEDDDFAEGGNWRQSFVRPREGNGKGLFDFD